MSKGSCILISILTAVLVPMCSQADLEKGSTEGVAATPAPSQEQALVEEVRGEPFTRHVAPPSPASPEEPTPSSDIDG